MKPFLILGDPTDVHVHYVAWALRTAGCQTRILNSSHDNCPTSTTLSLEGIADDFTSTDWNDVEAAWCRRLSPPFIPHQNQDEDEAFTFSQEREFTRWFISMLERCRIRWINPPSAAQAGENKFIQLKTARLHGISVPRTLVTAQPDRFREFLRVERIVVAKPLVPFSWKHSAEEMLSPFASLIDAERGAELSDEDIARCVTMYQQRIDKVADVRVVIMGQDAFAYKIIQGGEPHFDFRIGFLDESHLSYEPISVPGSLKHKIVAFMGAMNLDFASADFALTADGNFVFLDLNPSGQWTFIEHRSPEARVGQKFCSFFVNGRVASDNESVFPSISAYRETDEAKSLDAMLRQYAAAWAAPSEP